MGLNKKQLAIIHIAAKDLGLSREEYESILKTYGGAESAKYLSDFGFEKVMKFFSNLGFKGLKAQGAGRKGRPDLSILASEGQRKLLYHLMEDLGWWPARLYGFISKMTLKERPEELTGDEASKCIEGLKKMRDRAATWN